MGAPEILIPFELPPTLLVKLHGKALRLDPSVV